METGARGRLSPWAMAGIAVGMTGVVAVVGIGGVALIRWIARYVAIPATEAKDRIELIKAVAAALTVATGALTAFGLLATLVFTGLTFRATQRTLRLSQETLDVNRRTQAVSEQKQTNDRFLEALERLGAMADAPNGTKTRNVIARVGALYALERVARDAPQTYHATVVAVIAAYVRAESPRAPAGQPAAPPPGADIHAALSVLGRRDNIALEAGRRLDLSGADLRGLHLAGARFSGEPVGVGTGAILDDAVLSDTDLTGADLRGADMRRVILTGATLLRADFWYADITDTSLGDQQRADAIGDAEHTTGW